MNDDRLFKLGLQWGKHICKGELSFIIFLPRCHFYHKLALGKKLQLVCKFELLRVAKCISLYTAFVNPIFKETSINEYVLLCRIVRV